MSKKLLTGLSLGLALFTVLVTPTFAGTFGIASYNLNGTTTDVTVNPVKNPVQVNLTASEPTDWIYLKIEKEDDSTLYKAYTLAVSCDGNITCSQAWNGGISTSGKTLAEGTYRIRVHIASSTKDFNDYVTPYVIIVDTTTPLVSAPINQTFETTGATTTPVLVMATATDSVSSTTVDYSPKEFPVGTTTVTWTATDAAGNTATTSSLVIITEKVVVVPPVVVEATSTLSHRGGSSIVKVNFALASSTGQVLGTSTEKILKEKVIKRKLTPEEKKARVFKRKLNHIKIAIYDLKHPVSQVPPIEIVFGTSTTSSSAPSVVNSVPLVPTNLTVSDSGEIVGTTSKATTTPKKKPFWKLW